MKNLFIIDGLAGTGKSDCLDYIHDNEESLKTCVIKKYTTRPQRTKEKEGELNSDLIFVTQQEFDAIKNELKDRFITYRYGRKSEKYDYGFSLKKIEEQFSECKNVFLIIRDVKTIEKLITLYSNIYNIIPVFIFTDTQLVKERLIKLKYNEDEINYRLQRNEDVWEDYASQNTHIYRHTIINNSDKTTFHRLIKQLLEIYNKKQAGIIRFDNGEQIKLGNNLSGHAEKIHNFLKKFDFNKNIFLMIKYRRNNKILRLAIKKWVNDKGFNCIIADENEITNDVYNPIALSYCCRYGIAVYDEPEEWNAYSPNVAYELGSMQSQFKQCLIVKHSSLINKNFFDILKDNVNYYEETDELETIINRWIDGLIN